MRRLLLLTFVLTLCAASTPAGEGTYGEAPSLTQVTEIADIVARPHDFEGKLVQVRGEVTAVCQHMGCWLRVGDPGGALLLARSTGDKITIPTDSAGRPVVVEGIVVVEHEGGEEPEPGPHDDCPTATVRLETRGITLG